ncbi:hypothetical protein OEZ86_014370 [Tetradesmus obliquus]|nr:hypothetical protein OEZ86_014370 [Tetradesmus obliquus]
MLRLLSTLRKCVLTLGSGRISIHVDQASQYASPLLSQWGAGLGRATAAEAAVLQSVLHLQRGAPCSLAVLTAAQRAAHTSAGTAGKAGEAGKAGKTGEAAQDPAAAARKRLPRTHVEAQKAALDACSTLDASLDSLRLTSAALGLTASSSSSSSSVEDALPGSESQEQAYAALRSAVRPGGDHWLLLRCGEWREGVMDSQQRTLEGPALALLQVWALEGGGVDSKDTAALLEGGGVDSKDTAALLPHMLWCLGADGQPGGSTFNSCSEFEGLTSCHVNRKYITSCMVLNSPRAAAGSKPGTLRGWLETRFGKGTKLERKLHPYKRDEQRIAAAAAARQFKKAERERKAADRMRKRADREAAAAAAGGRQPYRTTSAAARRLAAYTGGGMPVPGHLAARALELAAAAAAAAAAAGSPASYVWPPADAPPAPLPTKLNMHKNAFRLEELQALAESAEQTLAAGGQLQPQQHAVVPDASRPFTITLRSGADGREYVVAHYEPQALAHDSSKMAALLCEIFHSRHGSHHMRRTSAPQQQRMVMAGMRLPRRFSSKQALRFGRYVGDTGPEADQFAFSMWPELRTAGGLRQVSQLWLDTLPGLFCAQHREAAGKARSSSTASTSSSSDGSSSSSSSSIDRERPWKGPPANFPSPTLLGSPFTTLAVTHNYKSFLHAEPWEHPFSYICWLDVLGPGSELQVGYFWLTPALAFTPRNGSALYIDVRLVPHCSDPCSVANSSSDLEGRYGAALFIKPAVVAANIKRWAEFDAYQAALIGAGSMPSLEEEQEQGGASDAESDAGSSTDSDDEQRPQR